MHKDSLIFEVFTVLREYFFDDKLRPKKFYLRDKRETQDDPLDEFISEVLKSNLKNSTCYKSSGPLISPDLVISKDKVCENKNESKLKDNEEVILGIEVKKLKRGGFGKKIARNTGLDYNSTPPCGTIRIYDLNNRAIDIKGYYLFICLENTTNNEYIITAMVLCDGDILNEDFNYYLQITGKRTKEIGIGSYGDGMNRNRPMIVFANPLGNPIFDYNATLITSIEDSPIENLSLVYKLSRTNINGHTNYFYAYRQLDDIDDSVEIQIINEPFNGPKKREEGTQARGRFKLPFGISEG